MGRAFQVIGMQVKSFRDEEELCMVAKPRV